MSVRISTTLCDRICYEAAATPGQEVCGLLVGTPYCIEDALACRNVAEDPASRFEIDPAALIAAHRRARAGGALVIGCYHSHPTGSALPSPRDAADAAPDDSLWIIISRGEMTCWRTTENGQVEGRFDAVALLSVTAAA